MRSTQTCESMNVFLNWFLKIHLRLYKFVQHFDRAITRIRHHEAKAKFESNNSTPIMSTKLIILEVHAATIFTKEFFFKFHEEVKNAELLFAIRVLNNDTSHSYTLSKFRQFASTWEVQFYPQLLTLKCSCMMFKSIGIPYAHMVVVMKVEHLEEIHNSCILKRWTKLDKC